MNIASPAERVPVTVLTGFLGSGKTTLLNQILRRPDLADTAVVVNELGEIGLDHLLVVGAQDNIVLLNAGCLCCAMLNTFKETLADLWYRRARGEVPAFARVIVETTGLADPAPILQSLLRDSFLAHYYRLGAVIATVDGVLGEDTLDRHPEARKQAALADRLVVTKTDITGGQALPSLRSRLATLNPGATVHDRPNGRAAIDFFAAGQTPDLFAASPHVHDRDIRADSFVIPQPSTWAGIAGWCDFATTFFGKQLLRCKGLLALGGDSRPVLIQGVQTVFAAPVTMPHWPDDDHRSRLVCITQGIDEAILRQSLVLLHATPGTYRPASVNELMAQT